MKLFIEGYINGCTSAASAPTVVTVNSCANAWTGGTSTDWANPSNWSAGSLPITTTDVTIPSTQRNPVIGGTVIIKWLTVSTGVSLTVNGTLNSAKNLLNNGSVSVAGTIELNGTTAQTVSGTGFDIANLTIANAAGASLNTTLGITAGLNLTSGTLNTNGNLIIRSNASGTGLIDDFSAGNTGTINGTIKIERYYPNTGWHLVAAPVIGSTYATLGLARTNIQNWSEEVNTTVAVAANCTSNIYDINESVFVKETSAAKYILSGTANSGNYS